jgi:hypothetical protein
MKTLGLIAAVFYLTLTAVTQMLLHQGGDPLHHLARSGPPRLLASR